MLFVLLKHHFGFLGYVLVELFRLQILLNSNRHYLVDFLLRILL